jgi:hypothetical protein
MSWREFSEEQARRLTPTQVSWRKHKYLEQLSDIELMDWSIGRNMKLMHASEIPPQSQYKEFYWVPREAQDDV